MTLYSFIFVLDTHLLSIKVSLHIGILWLLEHWFIQKFGEILLEFCEIILYWEKPSPIPSIQTMEHLLQTVRQGQTRFRSSSVHNRISPMTSSYFSIIYFRKGKNLFMLGLFSSLSDMQVFIPNSFERLFHIWKSKDIKIFTFIIALISYQTLLKHFYC